MFQILLWWFNTKVALLNGNSGYGGGGGGKHNNVNSNTHASQHACSSLCDEVVILWRLAALNPGLAPQERDMLHNQFMTWHLKIMEKISKCRSSSNSQSNINKMGGFKFDLEVFTGFKPAIEACYLDWDDYPMPGITYTQDINPMYHCPFTCFRQSNDNRTESVTQVNSSKAVLNCEHTHSSHMHSHNQHRHHHHNRLRMDYMDVMSYNPVEFHPSHHSQIGSRDGNRSSVSSEGFCENEDDLNMLRERRNILRSLDSDSQEGGGSDSGSSTSSSSNVRTGPSTQQSVNSEDSDGGKKDFDKTLETQTSVDSKKSEVETSSSNDEKLSTSRRFSKGDSSSSSNTESPQYGDEYNVYYYNSKDIQNGQSEQKDSKQSDDSDSKPSVFASIKKSEDPWDILFARAEGLHAHGHGKEACTLGVTLAEELLAHPPDLMIDIPPIPKRKGKKQQVNPASHQLSCLASATLAKCAFLCSVLAENPEYSHLAFRVGMFGLEMARPPASTKPLEVKLANQESDLVSLLKKLPLGPKELAILRERAQHLKDGTLKSRGEAMLPIMLASFIFDALVVPSLIGRERTRLVNVRLGSDEPLAFEAAVAALGLKANVSEADHPLLCEGTRRQRGDLAITLLVFYKDDCWKVSRIMDKLLDREIHQLVKAPIVSSFYSSNPPVKSQFTNLKREECDKVISPLNSYVPAPEMLPDISK